MKITKEYIKEKQYKTTNNLMARICLHNKFSNYSFHSWVWGNLPIPMKPLRILQVGCGTGQFFKENHTKLPNGSIITLTDISPSMLNQAKENIKRDNFIFEVADMENLRYDDNSFDIVIAHHIIYHATSKNIALLELKRVVKEDGFVSITTNSKNHMLNLFQLGIKLDKNFPKDRHIDSFTMEIADKYLCEYFVKINKRISFDNLYVSNANYLTDFIRSEIEPRMPNLNKNFYKLYNKVIQEEIKKNKFFIIPKISPLYICYKRK